MPVTRQAQTVPISGTVKQTVDAISGTGNPSIDNTEALVASLLDPNNPTALITPANEGGHLATIDTQTARIPARGAATTANSLPVNLASDQVGAAGTAAATVLSVQGIAGMTPVAISGTVTATVTPDNEATPGSTTAPAKGALILGKTTDPTPQYQPLPLTNGGAAVKTDLSGTTVPLPVGAALDTTVAGLQVSQASTTSGQKGALSQAAVTTAAPTYTTGQTSPLSLTTTGLLRVDASGAGVSLAAGSNSIGTVVTNADTTIGGTSAPAKTHTIGGKTNDVTPQYQPLPLGTSGRSVIIEGNVSGTPVPISGSISVSSGTFTTNADVAPGATTAPAKELLVGGKTTDVTPQYQPIPLTNGGASVKVDLSGTTVPLPTNAALDASVTGLQVTQGSATATQKGSLIQGAVTTAAPTYTTAQTSPLSLTTSGLLRVDASGAAVGLAAGSNAIGTVGVTTLPALPAGSNAIGTVGVTSLVAIPAGTNSIGTVVTNADTTISGTTAPAKGLLLIGKTNDGTPIYAPLAMGPGGRSIIVEGNASGVAVPSRRVDVSGNAIGETPMNPNRVHVVQQPPFVVTTRKRRMVERLLTPFNYLGQTFTNASGILVGGIPVSLGSLGTYKYRTGGSVTVTNSAAMFSLPVNAEQYDEVLIVFSISVGSTNSAYTSTNAPQRVRAVLQVSDGYNGDLPSVDLPTANNQTINGGIGNGNNLGWCNHWQGFTDITTQCVTGAGAPTKEGSVATLGYTIFGGFVRVAVIADQWWPDTTAVGTPLTIPTLMEIRAFFKS